GDVSFSAVQRIWRKHGLQPHRLERHLVSNDCHIPAHRSQFVSGVMEPVDFRRNGATAFSAYWSQWS
ncbi:MAG TPA: hypothetical protein VGH84_06915, partial [Steroidobacteraceae bacterium]